MSMVPEKGAAGTRFELQGTGMIQVAEVTLGGMKALFVPWDDSKLVL